MLNKRVVLFDVPHVSKKEQRPNHCCGWSQTAYGGPNRSVESGLGPRRFSGLKRGIHVLKKLRIAALAHGDKILPARPNMEGDYSQAVPFHTTVRLAPVGIVNKLE